MRTRSKPAALLVALIFTGAAGTAAAQSSMQAMVGGTIATVGADGVTITAPDGTAKSVAIGPSTLVLGRERATLDSIQQGDALGVTATREPDGSLSATEINIFSKELWAFVRRARSGQFPMSSGKIMTNEEVTQLVPGSGGHVLSMQYAGNTATINVPDGVVVHRLVTESAGDLKVGMRVLVRGSYGADGTLDASSINFELR